MWTKKKLIVVVLVALAAVSWIGTVSIRRAMIAADQHRCLSNLRSIGQAIAIYEAENKGALPPNLKFVRGVMRGKGAPMDCSVVVENKSRTSRFLGVFDCPAGGNSSERIAEIGDPDSSSDYIYLGAGAVAKKIKATSVIAYEPLSNHSGRGASFLYGDGSARFLGAVEAKKLIAALDDGTSPFLPRSGVTRTNLNQQAWDRLAKDRAVVVLIRHAETEPGGGDPPNFKIEDRSTQRNLSELGRLHAIAINQQLADHHVPFDLVITSPWFRCKETAKAVAGDHAADVQVEPLLGVKAELADLRQLIRRVYDDAHATDRRILLVTHATVIRKLTGFEPAPGELLLLVPGRENGIDAGPSLLEREWASAAAK